MSIARCWNSISCSITEQLRRTDALIFSSSFVIWKLGPRKAFSTWMVFLSLCLLSSQRGVSYVNSISTSKRATKPAAIRAICQYCTLKQLPSVFLYSIPKKYDSKIPMVIKSWLQFPKRPFSLAEAISEMQTCNIIQMNQELIHANCDITYRNTEYRPST